MPFGSILSVDVTLMEFIHRVFTCMPGDSYRRRWMPVWCPVAYCGICLGSNPHCVCLYLSSGSPPTPLSLRSRVLFTL